MYYPANDNELLYLIKDGNEAAKRTLYSKYEYLIAKIYRESSYWRTTVFSDFKQECLMCLEQAIYSFQEKYKVTFLSYVLLLIRRRVFKLLRKNELFLKERNTQYVEPEFFLTKGENPFLLKSIILQMEFEDELERDLFFNCLLQNVKITQIAQIYGLNYQSVYLKYKKIKDKVENILTNSKV
ncbi:MAG: hypothetical protein K2N64_00150 [Anaeroplasmataceae bacterium]|nr:hypothetical protein [Anaeroplasmataceae bacterium]